MTKLIKITIQYIIRVYTTDRYILIIGISVLQKGWRWHCPLEMIRTLITYKWSMCIVLLPSYRMLPHVLGQVMTVV